MKLTKREAIDYSIELWEWLAETSKEKHQWPKWKEYGDVADDCFLCEYNDSKSDEGCSNYCPLYKIFNGCFSTYFRDWCDAPTKIGRKKYAKLFLEQLKALK